MPSTQADIAFAHRQDRIDLQYQVQKQVGEMWATASTGNLDSSWDALAPAMVKRVVAGQVAAARQAAPYLKRMNTANGVQNSNLDVVPEAFGGVMLDGREVGPAMYTAVTTTKTLIGQGLSTFDAFQRGAAALSVIVGAAIQDMGRQSDMVSAAGHTYTKYVRVCNGSACSRCAILAGIWSAKDAFLRHACCQCGTAPIQVTDGREGKPPDGFFASPHDLFHSLTREQQDKTFTKAGAEAIRQGADVTRVVNARRGAYGIRYNGHYNIHVPPGRRLQKITIGRRADGSPLQVYATTEGTTIRGEFGRRQYKAGQATTRGEGDRYRHTTTLRLMPEQIRVMAGSDERRWQELLQRYGYLDPNVAIKFGVQNVR